MPGRLPLLHGGGVTWDEWAVFVGFALVIGLLTHWIDYRKRGANSAGDDPGNDPGEEDGEGAQADERSETRVGEVGHGINANRRFALNGLPE